MVAKVTKFSERHCHKWAHLLHERQKKLKHLLIAKADGNIKRAKRLFAEIFYGMSAGKNIDPGMQGSLLYHMAMVTKMQTETNLLLKENPLDEDETTEHLGRFFDDFISDAVWLTKNICKLKVNPEKFSGQVTLSSSEKIHLFTELTERTVTIEWMLESSHLEGIELVKRLFKTWSQNIVEMRLRQEYETIRGFLITASLAGKIGLASLEKEMKRVQKKFGEETVRIALDVTLKVGMRREKLQSVMLSDHFINYEMDMTKLDGHMQFLNCPIYGSHNYVSEKLGIRQGITSVFCMYFCYAHAKAMLNTVLPFTFKLWQPKQMARNGICDFYLKLAYSSAASKSAKFVPLVISWNITQKCNLNCSHCYINAEDKEFINELTTEEAKNLIDQISEVSKPLLILSGGEPLLREDVYELISYGTAKGFKIGLGSNGSLIDDVVARKLREAGIETVSISLDSHIPEQHDKFRGVLGSWKKAVEAIKALRENNVLVQVNTTLTQQNFNQIGNIMSLAENLGVENFHLFFLVPTGRGVKIIDISPAMYESMIKKTFARTHKHKLNLRFSCAPQFMRVAKDMGIDVKRWIRGCIAALYYCRVYPNGDITPCPYLPIKLGNIRDNSFKEIWFTSEIFRKLREFANLKGKCGICEFRTLCGGCRARAYGLSSDFIDYCGDLHRPAELKGDYLAEDPWCVYQPNNST